MALIWLTIAILLTITRGQLLPENACPQYFQYVNNGGGRFEGEVTLPTLVQGRNRIDLRFSQKPQQNPSVVGSLFPYPDDLTLRANVVSPKFRLSLWPDATSNVLPKLTRLAFNDANLCTASEYNPPNSFFGRFYELEFNGPIRLPPPTASVFNPFARNEPDVSVQTLFFDQTGQVKWQRLPTDPPPIRWQPQPAAPDIKETPRTQLSPQSVPPIWEFGPVFPPTTTTTTAVPPIPPPSPSPAQPTPTSPPVFQPSLTNSAVDSFNRQVFNECGFQGRSTPFIHKGEEFPRGLYPWLTAVHHKEHLKLAFKCGGSLVSKNQVITAGHCVYKIREDRVLLELGRYDLDDYTEAGYLRRDVSRILVHPQYSTRVMADADVAILTMKVPLERFDDIISPICLWQESDSTTMATKGFVAGWGKDELGNSMTRLPRVTESKIVTLAECLSSWVAVQRISNRTLCAGNLDGSGPCLGDSGGGLMVMRNNRWLLRGVVSLGERGINGQCELNQYVLYCDLAEHVSWINENLS